VTLNPKPETRNSIPYTLYLIPYTLNTKRLILTFQFLTLISYPGP